MEQAKQGHTAADGQSEPDMLANWLRQLRPRQTLSHGGLRLVLVSASGAVGAAPRYRPLEAAIAASVVTVTETAQAQVPALEVINKGDLPVLLLDGEEVVGGRQNRVVNSTLLVPPRCRFLLPVSCVEQGRWQQRTAAFAAGEAAFPALRTAKAQHVTAAYARAGAPVADQAAVWNEVAGLHFRQATSSRTHAMRDAYVQRNELLEQAERALTCPDGDAIGVVAVAQDHAFCADLFDHPLTLRAYWTRLVRSYAVEAADAPPASAPEDESVAAAGRLLSRAVKATRTSFPSPGLGQDVRFDGPRIVGAALAHDGAAIHTALFRRTQPEQGGATSSTIGAIRRPSQRARRFGLYSPS